MGCAQSVHGAEVRRERQSGRCSPAAAPPRYQLTYSPPPPQPPLLVQAAAAAARLPSAGALHSASHPHSLDNSPAQQFGDDLYEKALAAVYANKALPPGGPPSAELEGRRI